MHGVPSDVPLGRFVGHEINQIAVGRFQIQFHPSGTGSIWVEGPSAGCRGWELRDRSGVLIDRSRGHGERDNFRIHQILDLRFVSTLIDPPRSFKLSLESGHTLEIFDDSDRYESFSIHFDGKPYCFI